MQLLSATMATCPESRGSAPATAQLRQYHLEARLGIQESSEAMLQHTLSHGTALGGVRGYTATYRPGLLDLPARVGRGAQGALTSAPPPPPGGAPFWRPAPRAPCPGRSYLAPRAPHPSYGALDFGAPAPRPTLLPLGETLRLVDLTQHSERTCSIYEVMEVECAMYCAPLEL
jgi:hypothetical protein